MRPAPREDHTTSFVLVDTCQENVQESQRRLATYYGGLDLVSCFLYFSIYCVFLRHSSKEPSPKLMVKIIYDISRLMEYPITSTSPGDGTLGHPLTFPVRDPEERSQRRLLQPPVETPTAICL